jgi:magnesium-protoporphyrin IX monomethyl ester (oxidative) cyclase
LFHAIDAFSPDIIGVSVTFTIQNEISFGYGEKLKERYPDKLLIGGGFAVSADPAEYLAKSRFDYLILEEGEYRFEQLLINFENNISPCHANIDGIAYRTARETVIVPASGYIEDINKLPMMDRSLLDQEKYLRIGRPQALFCRGNRATTLFVGKGCPQKCTFCSNISINGRRLRYRSVKNILAEVEYLKANYDIDEIQFFCENLTANRRWAKELFEGLAPYNIHWCTPTGLYFNSIDFEMLELMAKAGAYQITLAIESANKRVLKELMHKNVQVDRVKGVVDKAHALGMAVHGFFMVGMPGETREEIQNTLRFPFESNFDSVSYNIVNAFKPSELYDLCRRKGYLAKDELRIEATSVTNIRIPEDSPDFSYSPEELAVLVKQASVAHFEWSKSRFPEIWNRKYAVYLRKHPEDAEAIKLRI